MAYMPPVPEMSETTPTVPDAAQEPQPEPVLSTHHEVAELPNVTINFQEEVRQALNVGPPSDSDVKPDASAKRLVEIVRARSVLMLDERDQRVALAQEVEALKRQAEQEHVKLIARLNGWMSGDETNVRRELEDQVIRAVEAGSVTAHDAINALRHRRSLAELVLAVDFGDNDIPF